MQPQQHVQTPTVALPQLMPPLQGHVYLKFATQQAAEAASKALHGRYYSGSWLWAPGQKCDGAGCTARGYGCWPARIAFLFMPDGAPVLFSTCCACRQPDCGVLPVPAALQLLLWAPVKSSGDCRASYEVSQHQSASISMRAVRAGEGQESEREQSAAAERVEEELGSHVHWRRHQVSSKR